MVSGFQGKRLVPPINWRGVPLGYHGKMSAVCRTFTECNDLVKWFGDAEFCPFAPIFLMIPGTGGIVLAGLGYATAAELRDDAVTIWEEKSERLAKTGSLHDFDTLREKHGLMRREDVREATREAFHERIRQHMASPVTDPFREPQYVRVNGKTVHAVAKLEEVSA